MKTYKTKPVLVVELKTGDLVIHPKSRCVMRVSHPEVDPDGFVDLWYIGNGCSNYKPNNYVQLVVGRVNKGDIK